MMLIHMISNDKMLMLTQGQGHKVKGQGQICGCTPVFDSLTGPSAFDSGRGVAKGNNLVHLPLYPLPCFLSNRCSSAVAPLLGGFPLERGGNVTYSQVPFSSDQLLKLLEGVYVNSDNMITEMSKRLNLGWPYTLSSH